MLISPFVSHTDDGPHGVIPDTKNPPIGGLSALYFSRYV